jgi:hypothetical protein
MTARDEKRNARNSTAARAQYEYITRAARGRHNTRGLINKYCVYTEQLLMKEYLS